MLYLILFPIELDPRTIALTSGPRKEYTYSLYLLIYNNKGPWEEYNLLCPPAGGGPYPLRLRVYYSTLNLIDRIDREWQGAAYPPSLPILIITYTG